MAFSLVRKDMGHDSVFLDSFLRQEPLINHSVYSSPYLDVAMATLQVGTLFCFPGHLALLRSRAKHILSLLSCNPGNSMKQYSVFLAPRPLLGESHLSCHEGLSKARYPQTSVTLKDMWSKISDYLPPFIYKRLIMRNYTVVKDKRKAYISLITFLAI